MDYLYILYCIYFFLPAYFANAFPPLANTFNILSNLNKPVDGGMKWNGIAILGDHKTWRGVICELIICTLLVQYFFYLNTLLDLNAYNYIGVNPSINTWILGILLSIGIIFGDLFFAFIKRRIQIKPGKPFVPFDQTNYVIGAYIFIEPYLHLGIAFWGTLFLLTFFVHILCNRLGYNLGLHKAKW